tara:strand:+ start:1038 stop:1757 length:720 start_codon:yes stop_codon:yes gene_type:complete
MLRLSIVVPAYNEEETIEETLISLKEQDYSNIELIVVDNNSSDRTNELAKKQCNSVYLETEQGYIAAVNRGAKEATGDLITFCDADSFYPKNWASQIVTEFEKSREIVAVYGSADTHDSNAIQNHINGFFYTLFLRISRLLGLDNTSGFNFVMRRASFIKVGGYDPKFKKMSPDIELGKRLKKEGLISFNPSIKVRSSFRRYQESGVLSTQWMFFKAWWAMLRNVEPSVSYDEYNQIKK